MTPLGLTIVAVFVGGIVLRRIGIALERAALRRAARQRNPYR